MNYLKSKTLITTGLMVLGTVTSFSKLFEKRNADDVTESEHYLSTIALFTTAAAVLLEVLGSDRSPIANRIKDKVVEKTGEALSSVLPSKGKR